MSLVPRAAELGLIYRDLIVDPIHEKEAHAIKTKIESEPYWSEYKTVSNSLGNFIPPWYVGCLHYRENTSLSLHAYLGNGQLIVGSGKKSTIVPVGRGPFRTFHEGAVDILKMMGFEKFMSWTPGECLERAEKWNGLGYKNRNVPNPYLFAGTSAYSKGKYSRDGHYDPDLVDKQLGFACLLKQFIPKP